MKKILLAASLAAVCSFSWAQTGEVPPDYPAQAAQYQTNPVDAQIEAVRRNYEDVKARAQMRLDAEKRAKEEREAAQAASDSRSKGAALKAAKQEKYQDEERELELEMKRLDVRSKKSDIETKEAINREKARRANEIVERMLESDSPAKTRERSY